MTSALPAQAEPLRDASAPERPRAGVLRVRGAKAADANALWRVADNEAAETHANIPRFTTLEYWQQRLHHASQMRSDNILLVAETASVLGYVSLFLDMANPTRRHAATLSICVGAEHRGAGVGSRLLHEVLGYADDVLGLVRVELQVWPDNAACSLYARHGFVQEGVLRAYALRRGRYCDALLMARVRTAPSLQAADG